MPRRGISRFPKENFLSHSVENFPMGTIYCVTVFECRKKIMLKRVMARFPVEFFPLAVSKDFVRKRFSVSLILGIEKVYHSGGYVTILC